MPVAVFRQPSHRSTAVNAVHPAPLMLAIAAQSMRPRRQELIMVKLEENRVMVSNKSRLLAIGVAGAVLAACGGGNGGSSMSPPMNSAPQSAPMAMLVSDASSEDWAMIGVKILSIALVPQGGGSNVTVYTAPSPVPVTNLVDLDNLSEVLGNASLVTDTAMTFTSAIVTLSANPGDVTLTAASDPESGFQAAPGAVVPAANIQIQHPQGSAPNMTVAVPITFDSPMQVTPGQASQLNVEFNLGHPAFIMAHTPPVLQGTTIWAVNFSGPVRQHPQRDITRLVMRPMYRDVASLSADNSSVSINKELPTVPPANPETAVT